MLTVGDLVVMWVATMVDWMVDSKAFPSADSKAGPKAGMWGRWRVDAKVDTTAVTRAGRWDASWVAV